MPTSKIDERYSVTIRSDKRRGGGWGAEGEIYVTATGRDIGVTVRGQGRTKSAADGRALAEARTWSLTRREDPDEEED